MESYGTFGQLGIDQTFHFDHSGVRFTRGLAQGPWRKISPRRYVQLGSGMVCRVGSVKVKVVRDPVCP